MKHSKQQGRCRASILHRLVRHWRGLLWIVGIIGAFVLLVLSVQWWMRSIGDEVSGWWSKIEDPNERGCAYIATAIAAHSLVMAFKSMSHDRIKVEVNGEAEAPGGGEK